MLTKLILVTMVAALSVSGEEASINWEADYGVALEQCKSHERPLLVVLDVPADAKQRIAPEWLKNKKNLDNYELCHVDVTTDYGKKVADVFRVKSFPHVAIIDRSGDVILSRMSGPVSEEKWLSNLSQHKLGLRKSEARRFQVSKPVVNLDGGIVNYPSSKPFCKSCQLRNQ